MKFKKYGGVKITRANRIMMVSTFVLFIVLEFVTYKTNHAFNGFRNKTEEYVFVRQSILEMEQITDTLTVQTERYVNSGNRLYLNSYFSVIERRDNLKSELNDLFGELGDEYIEKFSYAIEKSEDLSKLEYKAMKLAALGYNKDLSELPSVVSDIALTERVLNFDNDKKIETAISVIRGTGYQKVKTLLKNHLSYIMEAETISMNDAIENSTSKLSVHIGAISWLTIILFVFSVLTFVLITLFVAEPLRNYTKAIRSDNLVNVGGAQEIKELGKAYNRYLSLNKENNELLKHNSEHDSLTGCLNRTAFNRLEEEYSRTECNIGIAIVDIDIFKYINDTYGHDVGDKVIAHVANVLRFATLSRDKIIRFGGDEFVLLLEGFNDAGIQMFIDKINYINENLKNPQGELPKTSISCGLALSSSGYSAELFKNADNALYIAKNSGRSQCVVSDIRI